MRLSEVTEGTVVTLGHPDNHQLAVKGPPGAGWRWVSTGALVDPEDFRAGWDFYTPAAPAPAASATDWKDFQDGDTVTGTITGAWDARAGRLYTVQDGLLCASLMRVLTDVRRL